MIKYPEEEQKKELSYMKRLKVLVVDDVYTTGSSIMGVCNALRPHCKKIRALTLAKVS